MEEDEREDVLENRFFHVLQHQCEGLYAQAQKHCWLVVVPSIAVLPGLKLTAELIGRAPPPSPFSTSSSSSPLTPFLPPFPAHYSI